MPLTFKDNRVLYNHCVIGYCQPIDDGCYYVTDARDNHQKLHHYPDHSHALGHFYCFNGWRDYANTSPTPTSRTKHKQHRHKIWSLQ